MSWEEKIYGKGQQLNQFTWGDVYYYTHRFFLKGSPPAPGRRVLELGCGTGNNLHFFAELGMKISGIEGSRTALEAARERLTRFQEVNLIEGDFCQQLPFEDGYFDLILDRAALTHNTLGQIKNSISECYRVLKNGGKMFSMDFFSQSHSLYREGVEVEPNTKTGCSGAFQDIPLVHFTHFEEVGELFQAFRIEFVEEKILRRYIPVTSYVTASFNIVATKETG